MGKEDLGKNTNEVDLQTEVEQEYLDTQNAQKEVGDTLQSENNGNVFSDDSIADDDVVIKENVSAGESLGKYTDSAIADGVAVQGIFGTDLKISANTNDKEQRELKGQGIDAIYDDDGEDNSYIVTANEFDEMTNVIDGVKRKPRKKKKKKTRVRKIVVRTYATVIVAVLCIVGIYFGVTFLQESPAQGMEGAELRVDMEDLPHLVGTAGETDIDLSKMFPNGSNFKGNGSTLSNGVLKVKNIDSTAEYEITFTQTINETTQSVTRKVEVIQDAVNVSDWEGLSKAIKAEQVVCIQSAYIKAPEMLGIKTKQSVGFTLKNDLYGNGCKLNVFEVVCCRAKPSGGKRSAPYLQGNGAAYGDNAFNIGLREDGGQVLMQDLHVIGNDMSTEEGGNIAGLSDVIIQKRGLKLFSNYGQLIGLQGDITAGEDGLKGQKVNFKLKHCVLENGHKLIHIRYGDAELEGNIIRNASDTTISVATYANERSVITSRNNVVANSLTGGIVFYSYDGSIKESNAENSWNELLIEENTFLHIYNWKEQDGLAFMPETEDFASVANQVAKSEIPKKNYDELKSEVNGKKYVHFAIVKLRTGNSGLPINGSYVTNYEKIGYQTTRTKGYENGFPLPGIAASIIKDIDVWGYYERGDLDVTPTAVLDQETVEKLYKQLKNISVND